MFYKSIKYSLAFMALVVSASVGFSAEKGEKLTGAQLEGYLKGNTVYIDVLPGKGAFGVGGLSPFYYGPDGKFVADLPARKIAGTWKLSNDSSYCIELIGGKTTFCTDVFRKPTSIEHHSVGLNRLMGSVVRIVPGNDADL